MGNSLESKSLSLTTHRRLSDVLIELNLLTEEQVEESIQKAALKRVRMSDFLLQEGLITPPDLAKALAKQYDTEFLDLDQTQINPEAAKLIPEALIRNFSLLPIELKKNTLVIGTHDPIQLLKLENMKSQLPQQIEIKVCTKVQLDEVINRLFKNDHAVDRIVRHLSKKQSPQKASATQLSPAGASQKDNTPSIEGLWNNFWRRALSIGPGDI